ncbi:MAG TPA: amino acid adenylation domain-containing protein [Bryobacteraceae bacterium]|jgi:amino acid adenylation domain-containing protein
MAQLRQVSFAEQRLWFLELLEPGNAAYNLVCAIRITGILDCGALARSLRMIVERHESLRTAFKPVDGRVVAVVSAPPECLDLPFAALDHLPEDLREEQALQIAAEEGRRGFDLSGGPLIRFKLLRLSSTRHMLVLAMHHIVMDGWSIAVFLEEMGRSYEAIRADRPPDLPRLLIQYGDFAAWQREAFSGEGKARQLEYWERVLDGAPPVLDLPADRMRPIAPSHKGRRYNARLDGDLVKGVHDLCSQERATPFMLLLAAFETLLWRYTGVNDFVLGTAMAGRGHIELEPLIGLFVNTIALRANLSGDLSFRELLQSVRQTAIDAIANQDVPFEKLVEELKPERSTSYSPLFQTMFILHKPRTSFEAGGLLLEELEVDTGYSKFDLTLEIYELDGFCCTWEYDTELFEHARIVRMAGHFETLLRGICADPSRKLSQLPLLGAAERSRIVYEWNTTESAFPDGVCIHEAFERQAGLFPDSIAVIDDDRDLTYLRLNDNANRLAHYLRSRGVRPDDRVGVALERSADAIIALLAIMKTGASYVPIDPAYPKQRIEFMLNDSGVQVLITRQWLRNRLPGGDRTIFIDRDRAAIRAQSHLNPETSVACRSAAYVIYTSGSTGNPKGVLASHRASMNRFAWMWTAYPFRKGEICAHRTSLGFVDSVAEIFGPLLQGVPIFVVSEQTAVEPEKLVRQLERRRISRLVLVPSLLEAILDSCGDVDTRLAALRFCFSSGEVLPYGLWKRFTDLLPQTTLVNLYGSSEVAADVTVFDTSSIPSGFVPIGKPIANVRIYILDPNLNPVPIGIPGEIYVGGDCLALGYLDRPELTVKRFIADPFRPGDRLFKTGDLGRFGEDGNVEFLGRADNQIKIRGFRIEPGEIEAALRAHGSVREALVRLANRGTVRLLTAYVAPAQGLTVSHSELRSHLRTRLPDYMIPAAFVTLDALPMTPNGKIDIAALPQLDPAQVAPSEAYVAPRNVLEETIVAIWEEVLKIDRVGVFDGFFDLGGHSLLAAQIVARIRKVAGVEVPLRTLFEEPTVAALAAATEKARAEGAAPKIPVAAQSSAKYSREQLENRLRDLSDEEIDALLSSVLAGRRVAGAGDDS